MMSRSIGRLHQCVCCCPDDIPIISEPLLLHSLSQHHFPQPHPGLILYRCPALRGLHEVEADHRWATIPRRHLAAAESLQCVQQCCNYPSVNQAWSSVVSIPVLTRCGNCGTCSVGQVFGTSSWNNTLKDASVKWMKFSCVVPAFPLGP